MKRWIAPALTALGIGAVGCGESIDESTLVARIDDYALTIDQTVDLLVDEEQLAADARIVESLAELWIDYTLLAEAAAADTTFSELDLEPLVLQQVTQVMVFQLRDSVIQVDTFITEDELRTRYESDAPSVELRARHIMLQLPVQASDTQIDSVEATLESIRARAVGGESFEALARLFSQDPGSAANGGDLGYFQRGDMVAPFEEAALALEPGEISPVVRTPMGLHLIQVEDRRVQTFDDVALQYRSTVQARMVQQAESLFVAGLVEQAEPEVAEGAADIVRELAENPAMQLTGRAGRRALVEWTTGSVTVASLQEIFQLDTPQLRAQVSQGSEDEIHEFLMGIARRDLLIREAEANGLRPVRDSLDALVDDARTQLRRAARALGLLDLDQAPGEAVEVAVARAVEEALVDNLSGATQVVPLGLVSFQLREGRSSALFDAGVGQVILDMAEARSARALSPLEQAVDSVAAAAADTLGG